MSADRANQLPPKEQKHRQRSKSPVLNRFLWRTTAARRWYAAVPLVAICLHRRGQAIWFTAATKGSCLPCRSIPARWNCTVRRRRYWRMLPAAGSAPRSSILRETGPWQPGRPTDPRNPASVSLRHSTPAERHLRAVRAWRGRSRWSADRSGRDARRRRAGDDVPARATVVRGVPRGRPNEPSNLRVQADINGVALCRL